MDPPAADRARRPGAGWTRLAPRNQIRRLPHACAPRSWRGAPPDPHRTRLGPTNIRRSPPPWRRSRRRRPISTASFAACARTARRPARACELVPAILRSPERTRPGFSTRKPARCSLEGIVSKPADAPYPPGIAACGARSNACTARNSWWSAGPIPKARGRASAPWDQPIDRPALNLIRRPCFRINFPSVARAHYAPARQWGSCGPARTGSGNFSLPSHSGQT
jgi:hypothetical protein